MSRGEEHRGVRVCCGDQGSSLDTLDSRQSGHIRGEEKWTAACVKSRREVWDAAVNSRVISIRMAFKTVSLDEITKTQCGWRKGPGSRGIDDQRSERGRRTRGDDQGVIKEKREAQEKAAAPEAERRELRQGEGKGPLS